LATLAGVISGGIVGWLIYRTGSTTTLHWFLVSSTCLLFLIGAGLASKAVGFFEYYSFSRAVGGVSRSMETCGILHGVTPRYVFLLDPQHLKAYINQPGSASTNGGKLNTTHP
jgi:high-affinity iron transporter